MRLFFVVIVLLTSSFLHAGKTFSKSKKKASNINIEEKTDNRALIELQNEIAKQEAIISDLLDKLYIKSEKFFLSNNLNTQEKKCVFFTVLSGVISIVLYYSKSSNLGNNLHRELSELGLSLLRNQDYLYLHHFFSSKCRLLFDDYSLTEGDRERTKNLCIKARKYDAKDEIIAQISYQGRTIEALKFFLLEENILNEAFYAAKKHEVNFRALEHFKNCASVRDLCNKHFNNIPEEEMKFLCLFDIFNRSHEKLKASILILAYRLDKKTVIAIFTPELIQYILFLLVKSEDLNL